MTKKKLTFIYTLMFILLILVSLFLYNKLSKENPSENLSTTNENSKFEKALDFSVYDFQKNEIQFKDFNGKPTIINFWASWCPNCTEEMPIFDEMYKKYGKDINFMMINITDGIRETFEIGNNYIDESGFTFPVYFDIDNIPTSKYEIRAIPTTIFIDKNGNLQGFSEGSITKESLISGIKLINK